MKTRLVMIVGFVLSYAVMAGGAGHSAHAQSTTSDRQTVVSDKKTNFPEKKFELTFDDLKFEMEKGEKFDRAMLTPKINSYDQGSVRLRGYIRPSYKHKGLTKFIFVRDNKECCFGPGAALYDCVLVTLSKGFTANFTVRPVIIEGKFSLKEYKGPDGKIWAIYKMTDSKVK